MPNLGSLSTVCVVLAAVIGLAASETAGVVSASSLTLAIPNAFTSGEDLASGRSDFGDLGGMENDAAGTASPRSEGGPPGPEPRSLSSFAVHTGHIDYVAGGAAMRNQGYGTITTSWTGTLVAAYLVWGFISDVVPTSGTLNGVNIVGTLVASNPEDPCWAPGIPIHTLVADVTPFVVNGVNNLTEFPSGVTTGGDPWNLPVVPPLLEGASLVVIFNSGGTQREISLHLGADTIGGGMLADSLAHARAESSLGRTTFIVSDGQMSGNEAFWNSAVIDPYAFPGADPRTSRDFWSWGNLWDTRSYSVFVPLGATAENLAIFGARDCLTWHGQVLRVDAEAPVPNTPPTLSWTGEANYEVDGLDPVVGGISTAFAYRVAYADGDGDAPTWVELIVEKPAGIPWGTFPMNHAGWVGAADDYVAGAKLDFPMSLPAGTDYWYSFRASDGQDYATGLPTERIDAPDVLVDLPPIAVARAFPTVAFMADVVTFDGRDSTDDVGIAAYLWEFGDGVDDPGPVAAHAYTSRGTFTAQLSVWDTAGQFDADSVTIQIENRPPVADAGNEVAGYKRVPVVLDGTASSDSDGDALTYEWIQTNGAAVTILGHDSPTPTFTSLTSGTYSFRLSVFDGWGGASSDDVVVVVSNRPPVADAGPDRTVPKKILVALGGSGSDPDADAVAYRWAQIGGPTVVLSDAEVAGPTFVPPSSGTYTFRLEVDDGDGATAEDEVSITAANRAPRADAGLDVTVGKNVIVTLDGSAAADPDGDPLSYAWTQVGGPAVSLTPSDAPRPTFSPSAATTYSFYLHVDDRDGGRSLDDVLVTVTGLPPVAHLVASPVVAEIGRAIALDGGGSTDPDGRIVQYAFEFGDGETARGPETIVVHPYAESGRHTVTLTVTDDDGNVASTSAQVEVLRPQAPVVLADLNWKPIVAAVFAAALLAMGIRSSKRRPWRRDSLRDSQALTFAATSLPFVLAEVATGIISYFTGYLSIPPVLGLGMAVDGVILAAGAIVAIMRGRSAGERVPPMPTDA